MIPDPYLNRASNLVVNTLYRYVSEQPTTASRLRADNYCMGDAKDYNRDLDRLLASLEEKRDRIAGDEIKEWIRRAKAAGIGQITFLKRLTKSDEERKKVLSEILAKEAARWR